MASARRAVADADEEAAAAFRTEDCDADPVRVRAEHAPFLAAAVGVLESCFGEKHGTPRQGSIAPAARARLALFPRVPEAATAALARCSHVWLVFVFHKNNQETFKPLIRPPRLHGARVGVYATRSPHRFNPIGLTVARLEAVRGRVLEFSGIDIIDGTPMYAPAPSPPHAPASTSARCVARSLDVKPYAPADAVPAATVADWVAQPHASLTVRFTAAAADDLAAAAAAPGALKFFRSAPELRAAIEQSLSLDPRTLHSKDKLADGVFGFQLDRLDVCFRVLEREKAAEVFLVHRWPPEREAERTALRTQAWLDHVLRELDRRAAAAPASAALEPAVH